MIQRAIILISFLFLKPGTSDPLSVAETEVQKFNSDAFTFEELTTRSDRFPVRAGEKSCLTCQVASDRLEPYCHTEGKFAHFVSCKDYFLCDAISDKPVKLKCPLGEYFDKISGMCDDKEIAQCNGKEISFGGRQNEVIAYRSQTPRISLRPTRPNQQGLFTRNNFIGFFNNNLNGRDDGFLCPGNGLFANPTDCGTFYSCYDGGKGRLSCPIGLYFNGLVGVCDYPQNVNCPTGPVTTRPTIPPPTNPTLPTIPTTPDPTATVRPTTAPDPSLKRVCYYTNWSRYRPEPGTFVPKDIDKYFCTHLIYAFAVLDQNTFLIKAHDPWADFDLGGYRDVTEFKNEGLKVLLAIGGWTDSAGSKYSELVANQQRRANFISHVVGFLKDHNFDGLDLDWEFPRCWQSSCIGPAADKPNFVLFVKELRVAFNQQNPPLLLTAAVSANPNVASQAYDIPELSTYLDFFNLMAYDYHGSWEGKTGHVTPLFPSPHDANQNFNVDSSVTFYLDNGAPASKIVLGFPTYGRSFTLTNPSNNRYNAPATAGSAGPIVREAGTLSYTEICTNLRTGTWTKVKGTDAVGPYAYSGNQWVSYMDIEAVANFGEYVLRRGLGGAMVWALDFDDFNVACCPINSPLMSTIERVFTGVGPSVEDIISSCSFPGIDASNLPAIIPETKPTPNVGGGVILPALGIAGGAQVEGVDCLNSGDILKPDPKSCNHFYQCSNGRPIRMNCPYHLLWNDFKQYCDWPVNVLCILQ
ncbi:putative chitinase 10 [Nymphon striatum]|nr:putative chitinase 10 [Nymphon striatum]